MAKQYADLLRTTCRNHHEMNYQQHNRYNEVFDVHDQVSIPVSTVYPNCRAEQGNRVLFTFPESTPVERGRSYCTFRVCKETQHGK